MRRGFLNAGFGVIGLFLVISMCVNVCGEEKKIIPKKTQENKQTDLFERSIENWQEVGKVLEAGNQEIIESMSNGKAGVLENIYKLEEMEKESKKLEQLNEYELEARGREEMINTNTINEIYVDESLPGNQAYVRDVERLANAQEELLNNILGELKQFGIKCKTVKGNKTHEAEYYLDIQKDQIEDTIYNQVFCEQPYNTYHCHEHLIMRCKEKGTLWGEWEERAVAFTGTEVLNNHSQWFYAVFWKKKKKRGRTKHLYTLNIRNEATVTTGIREKIAANLGVGIGHIKEEIGMPFEGKGEGELSEGDAGDTRKWDRYSFSYQYRDGQPVCLQWDEKWSEECLLH